MARPVHPGFKSIARVAALSITLVLALAGTSLAEDGGEDEGGLHCTLGAIGLAFMLGTLITGLLTSGRLGRIKGLKTYPIHMVGTIAMSCFMTGEFVYGLLTGSSNFLDSTHGILGFLVPVFAWAATLTSPCFAGKIIKRKVASKVHAVLAIVMVILTAAQVYDGYFLMDD